MNNLKNEVVKFQSEGGMVELSYQIVRDIIAVGSNVSDSEIYSFMMLCKYRGLNPFLGQAHLVKFSDKAQIITGKDVFTQRLNNNPKCEGYEVGVILWDKDTHNIIEREGSFYLEKEELVGSYTIIHRKGWKKPYKWTINKKDYFRTYYNKKTNKTEPMGQWATMPSVMLTKCCMVAAIRNVFPEDFAGCYSEDELGVDINNINNAIDVTKEEINKLGDEKNKGKMQQLCIAAKSKNAEYNPEDLLKFAMKTLVKQGVLTNESKKEIPMDKYTKVLEFVKKLVKMKEEKEIKKENINKNNETDLPVINDNFAKPAHINPIKENTNTDTDIVEDKENESKEKIENEK